LRAKNGGRTNKSNDHPTLGDHKGHVNTSGGEKGTGKSKEERKVRARGLKGEENKRRQEASALGKKNREKLSESLAVPTEGRITVRRDKRGMPKSWSIGH